MPELVMMAYHKNKWKRISAESFIVSLRQPSRSRDWPELIARQNHILNDVMTKLCLISLQKRYSFVQLHWRHKHSFFVVKNHTLFHRWKSGHCCITLKIIQCFIVMQNYRFHADNKEFCVIHQKDIILLRWRLMDCFIVMKLYSLWLQNTQT